MKRPTFLFVLLHENKFDNSLKAMSFRAIQNLNFNLVKDNLQMIPIPLNNHIN